MQTLVCPGLGAAASKHDSLDSLHSRTTAFLKGALPSPSLTENKSSRGREGSKILMSVDAPALALHLCVQPGLPELCDRAFEVAFPSSVLPPHFPSNMRSFHLPVTLSPSEACAKVGLFKLYHVVRAFH